PCKHSDINSEIFVFINILYGEFFRESFELYSFLFFQVFTFKTLSEEEIVIYLERIATSESFSFSEDGLTRIARAARGGMRDAVNLMERVLAFTGSLDDQSVRLTLGILPNELITSFLEAFSGADPNRLLKVSKEVLYEGFSYESLLEQSIEFVKEEYVKDMRLGALQIISGLWEILKEMKYAEDKKAVFEVMTILRVLSWPV
ncbi:MAG TPA: hypothetical protein PKG97_09090, partial [Mesotoga infera]|nr:hypothetical protein [Mesotoga infera]